MVNGAPVEVVQDALIQYLRATMPELAEIIDDFPTPNQQLKYPAASLTHSADDGSYGSDQPYEDTVTDPASGQVNVLWVVGQWDFKMQLDLWTRSLVERDKLFQKAFAILNPKIHPMGLRLQLKNYRGVWCSLDVTGFRHEDGEQASQRGEWRSIVSLTATVNQVLDENVAAITQPLELQLDVVDNIQ